MKISICNKCKGFDYLQIIKLLEKKYNNLNFEIGCNNMCGIGRNKIVIIVNDIPIIANDVNELLKKIEETIN